jgi:putative methylase
MKKVELEIILSKLSDYVEKKPSLEQYSTPSAIAGDLLWNAFMKGDIYGKTIIDAGCGNGILGIGALLLGAKKAVFIDIDPKAVECAKNNLKSLGLTNYEAIVSDIFDINAFADIVLSNPPFGVQNPGKDKDFLMKCSQLAKKMYIIYKGDGLKILKKLFPDKEIELIKEGELLLKKQFSYHTKDKARAKIILAKIII